VLHVLTVKGKRAKGSTGLGVARGRNKKGTRDRGKLPACVLALAALVPPSIVSTTRKALHQLRTASRGIMLASQGERSSRPRTSIRVGSFASKVPKRLAETESGFVQPLTRLLLVKIHFTVYEFPRTVYGLPRTFVQLVILRSSLWKTRSISHHGLKS